MSHTFGLFMFWSGVACWCALILRSGFICSREFARRNRTARSDEHECDGQVQAQIAQRQV